MMFEDLFDKGFNQNPCGEVDSNDIDEQEEETEQPKERVDENCIYPGYPFPYHQVESVRSVFCPNCGCVLHAAEDSPEKVNGHTVSVYYECSRPKPHCGYKFIASSLEVPQNE